MTEQSGPRELAQDAVAAQRAGSDQVRSVDFEGLRIEYDARVLEPRPWTAAQSRWAAELIRAAPTGRVLEVCAGAGHIGLLAVTLAPRPLVCVDADAVACGFLRRNAAAAGVEVDVREGRMDAVLTEDEEFAVIIADPPWVPSTEVTRFPEDPVTAIDGGADGLDLTRSCLEVIDRHLVSGGSALLQVGPLDQTDRVADLVSAYADLSVVAVRGYERGSLLQIDRKDSGAA
jgi:methylase of polypeptide subunit release factors